MKEEIELNYEVTKTCLECGCESNSIKDFKPLSISWCHDSLSVMVTYKCNKCQKISSGWDQIDLSLLVELGFVEDRRPLRFQYSLKRG
jgi:DNA-directed RNA polymerase subunit RPC12/RpoP